MTTNQAIIPCLWFDKETEQAMNFYISVFSGGPVNRGNSKVISILRYEKGMETPGMPEFEGKILTAVFDLNGQRLIALDGGPIFKFNEAISLTVECDDQNEIDYYWGKLSAVPEAEQCGWLKDKYGLSWQIVPKGMQETMSDPDRKKVARVMNAVLKMKKIVIKDLESV